MDRGAFVTRLLERAHSASSRSSAKRAPLPATSPVAAKSTRLEDRSEGHAHQTGPMPLFTLAAGKDLDTSEARAAIAHVLECVVGAGGEGTKGTNVVQKAQKVALTDIETVELTQSLHTHFLQSWREYRSRCGHDPNAPTDKASASYSNEVLIATLKCLDGACGGTSESTGHYSFDRQQENAQAVGMHPPSCPSPSMIACALLPDCTVASRFVTQRHSCMLGAAVT